MSADTPAAWTAWRDRAMQLADEYAAFCLTMSTARKVMPPDVLPAWQEIAKDSRAALEAHLDSLPMGPVVAWAGLREWSILRHPPEEYGVDPDAYSPLYRHPKESAP